jgi:tRNA(Ile)-lysidine synthase
MIDSVRANIRKQKLFSQGDRLLLACSSGVDSMVLASILQELGYMIGLAHCNFELRGEESAGDQVFVERYAQLHGLPFFTINFNTKQFATKNKLTIQEAARFLRYTWLEDVRLINGFTHIITAHQQNDQAETVVQHIIKGAGLQGLQGIPTRNGLVVRPMLTVSRENILAYAKDNNIAWREDSSNARQQYDRNFIRLEVLPKMAHTNPAIIQTLSDMAVRMQEASFLTSEAVGKILRKQVSDERAGASLSIGFLRSHPAATTILYHWLHPAGFSSDSLQDIVASLSSESSGQEFLSKTHRLVRDRKRLYLMPNDTGRHHILLLPALPDTIHFNEWEIACQTMPVHEMNMKRSNRYAWFDADKVTWPLTIRYWREGDYFYPFGMGKRKDPEKPGKKKLSKYFKDEKLTPVQKEHTPVLLSGEKVLWLVGQRTDDRFKVTSSTKKVLKMVLTDGYEKG